MFSNTPLLVCLPIASPIGTNAEYIQDKVTGFLATNAGEGVDRISRLIENPQLREKMGQYSRAHATKFDISIIGEQFTELIKECLSKNQ